MPRRCRACTIATLLSWRQPDNSPRRQRSIAVAFSNVRRVQITFTMQTTTVAVQIFYSASCGHWIPSLRFHIQTVNRRYRKDQGRWQNSSVGNNNEHGQHPWHRSKTRNWRELRRNGRTKHFQQFCPELYALADKVEESETYTTDLREIFEAQPADPNCRHAVALVGKPSSTITFDTGRVLVLASLVDCTSEQFMLAALLTKILHIRQYSLLGGHPVERRMYDTVCCDCY